MSRRQPKVKVSRRRGARTAQELAPYASGTGKPILASWMGGLEVEAGDRILRDAGIATFPYPDSAARMFTQLVRYGEDLKSLYEMPTPTDDHLARAERDRARRLIDEARVEGRTTLSEPESKALLGAYGIPVVIAWQPVPTYGYDLRHHAFAPKDFGPHERSRLGYPKVAALYRSGALGPSAVWCADLQQRLAEPLYLDTVHYTPRMARRVARCLAHAVERRRLLEGVGSGSSHAR